MLRIKSDQFRPLPQLKVRKIKPRRDCTTGQCERFAIANPGSEPATRLDDCLQHLTGIGVIPQMNLRVAAIRLDYMDSDRAAGIEMPQLVRPQTMEGGEVFSVEQKVDRRRDQPRPSEVRRQSLFRDGKLRTIRLPVVPTLGMGDQVQFVDPV